MSSSTRQRLRVEIVEDVAIVHFVDREIVELVGERNDAHEVGEELYRLVEDGGHRKLLLNFSDVEFLSSAVLGKLLSLRGKLEKLDGRLILCGLTGPLVREVFRVTGLDRFFEIHDDEQLALDRFRAAPRG